jgi:hypothetical protein
MRIFGVVFQKPGPKDISHRGRTHGHAWMSRVGLLHRIYSEHANGVDTQIIQWIGLGVSHFFYQVISKSLMGE